MHSKGFVSSNKGSHPSLRECISENLSTTLIELFSLSYPLGQFQPIIKGSILR